jgi:hypothetical protein
MSDILEKHRKLLAAQDSKLPQMTIREMGEVIGSESTSYIKWILDKLIDAGLAVKIQRGDKHIYRLVEPGYKHNPGAHE